MVCARCGLKNGIVNVQSTVTFMEISAKGGGKDKEVEFALDKCRAM